MAFLRSPGTTWADATGPSLAGLPYEIQVAIFEAAAAPQIFFVEIADGNVTISGPANRGLALACRLSREIYIKSKTLHRFGRRFLWVDCSRDIFYLYKDDPIRPDPSVNTFHRLRGQTFDQHLVRNVGVDLQYVGQEPNPDALVRIRSLFPNLDRIHVFVPYGDSLRPALAATPESLELSRIPIAWVITAPGQDKELWGAVKYQIGRAYRKMLAVRYNVQDPPLLEVVGHFTTLSGEGATDGGVR